MIVDVTQYMYTGTKILFFVLLLLYTIHGALLAYHWYTYGSSKHISIIALSTYLAGGAVLFLTFSLGFNSL